MLRRFIAPLLVLLALAVVAQPWTARAEISPEQGKALVANIAERGINEVIAADVPLQEKVQRFRDMFLANFDVESTARFVLGRHWRTADPEQRKRFTELFRDYNVLIWSRRFDEYNGQKLKITAPARTAARAFSWKARWLSPAGASPSTSSGVCANGMLGRRWWTSLSRVSPWR